MRAIKVKQYTAVTKTIRVFPSELVQKAFESLMLKEAGYFYDVIEAPN